MLRRPRRLGLGLCRIELWSIGLLEWVKSCLEGKKLGRGFEPLGKGFKSFAFAELCHTSGSFSRS